MLCCRAGRARGSNCPSHNPCWVQSLSVTGPTGPLGRRCMYVTLNREQLLSDVWAAPLQTVAPRYGLSDVGLKKLCARLQVPTPGRGYWAKLKAGKRVPSPPTLKPYNGPPRNLHRYVPERPAEPDLTWEPTHSAAHQSGPLPQPTPLADPRLQLRPRSLRSLRCRYSGQY